MARVIECVPNFSEGKDKKKIKEITNLIDSFEKVRVLDVDMGFDTNRTVVTIAGEPEFVLEAVFHAIKLASEIIDMSKHSGTHPRMGSTDVCPIIPISNISIDECIHMSKALAKRVGDELRIPVYLYESSAIIKSRRNLADIRSGEYEGLPVKLKNKKWKPDYGPAHFNERNGAIAIGCRKILIAYNICLNTTSKRLATDIAFEIREMGRSKREPNSNSNNLLDGDIIRDEKGKAIKVKGLFKDLKAIGWYVDEYKKAQISINLIDYKVSSIHDVFDKVCELAIKRGIRVTGSELVGLVPLEAIIDAGSHFLQKQDMPLGIPLDDIIRVAINSLGLNDVAVFEPKTKIIEYSIRENSSPLTEMNIENFIDEISRPSPAPGGGSISALAGALSAALLSMVSNLSHNSKFPSSQKERMNSTGLKAQKLKNDLNILIDQDTIAFNNIIKSMKMPSNTKDQNMNKKSSIIKAYKYAIETPFDILNLSYEVLTLCNELILSGNKNSVSDAGVASELAYASIRGAYLNIKINLEEFEGSKSFSKEILRKINNIMGKSKTLLDTNFQNTIKVIKSELI